MATVTYNGTVIARSDETVEVEGNLYFPRESLRRELFTPNDHRTTCSWKGEAWYMTLIVDGQTVENVGWFYPDPKEEAKNIAGHVAFYGNLVEVEA